MDEFTRRHKDAEAFRWMYSEVLIRQFNDILTKEWYQYYLNQYIGTNNHLAKKKLKRHSEAIMWFLSAKDSLCFKVLEIDWLSMEKIWEAIIRKFNGDKKFIKILKTFAK